MTQGPETTTTQRPEIATTPKRPEASLGELVAEMTSELSTLFRQEVELAKVEARQEASRARERARSWPALASPASSPFCWCPWPQRGSWTKR